MKNPILKVLMIVLVAMNLVACQSEEEKLNVISNSMHKQTIMTSREIAEEMMRAKNGEITHADLLAHTVNTLNRHESFINVATLIKTRQDALDKQAEMVGLYDKRRSFENKTADKVYDRITSSMLYKMGQRHYNPNGKSLIPSNTHIYNIKNE